MSTIYKKTEFAANLLIAIVGVVVVGVAVQRFSPSRSAARSDQELPKVGDRVQLPDFDWSRSEKNVVLVLQKGCHFCSDSASFYEKLIQHSRSRNAAVVAVLPQSAEEANQYLKELRIAEIEVRQSQLDSILVAGTPTIIVANGRGEITAVWFGKLQPEKESEVLGAI
jgi:hypothetical protein